MIRPDIRSPEKEKRIPVTDADLFVGAHVFYGGPLSDFDCEVIAVLDGVANLKAVRSGTEFSAPVGKLFTVERQAT